MSVYSDECTMHMYNHNKSEDHSESRENLSSEEYVSSMAKQIIRDFEKLGYSKFVDKCATDKNFMDSKNEQIISKVYNALLFGRAPSQNAEEQLRFLKDYPLLKREAEVKDVPASEDETQALKGQNAAYEEEILRLSTENAALKAEIDKLIEEKKGIEYTESIKTEAEKILEEANHTREMLSRYVLEEAVDRDATDFPEGRFTKQVAERQIQALENELWTKFDEIRNETKKLTMDFRLGLYRDESRKLCRAYVRLNEFATEYMDKQIREITDALSGDAVNAVVRAKLLEIQGRAIKLVKELEVGMKYLEFAIIRPKPGEEYSPGEHLLAVDSDDGELEGTIKDCLSPGVKNASGVVEAAGVTVEPY